MKAGAKPFHYIMLFLAAIIWGSSFVAVKSSVDTIPPNLMVFIRFSLSCVLLSFIFFRQFKQLRPSTLWRGALCGLFLFGGYSLQTIGIVYTTPGKNAFLTAIYCVVVPFLFWAAGKVRPDIYNISAAVICLIGIGFIALDGIGSSLINKGDLLTILSGFAFSAHIVIVALSSRDENPVLITIVQFGMVALCAGVFSIFTESFPNKAQINIQLILEMGYLIVFATAAALLMQTVGQSRVNPSTASLIISFEAVFGVICSILFGYEKINVKTLIGFIFVFVAIIISETKLVFLKVYINRFRNKEIS